MNLTQLRNYVKQSFPEIKLSYELINYNKVAKYDYIYGIPNGIENFLWFTKIDNINYCILIDKKVIDKKTDTFYLKCYQTCVSDDLFLGTLLYGYFFKTEERPSFIVEDIFYYKSNKLNNYNNLKRIKVLTELFTDNIKQISINNQYLLLGALMYSNNLNNFNKSLKSLPYKIKFICFNELNNTDKSKRIVRFNEFFNEQKSNRNLNNNNNNNKNKSEFKLLNKNLIKTFILSADINTDTYNIYCYNKDNEKYFLSTALIPNYQTSQYMNNLFRIIKENKNLDSLEESDSEEEFEDEREDKYVNLEKEIKMLCKFNTKFKKWIPINEINENDTKNNKIALLNEIPIYAQE